MTHTYSSQLKGWAIDRAVEIAKLTKPSDGTASHTLDDIFATADKLVDYCFVETEAETYIRERIEDEAYNRAMAEAVAMPPASNAAEVTNEQ